MSLNAVTAGCNQKSNRYPQMELDQEDVLNSLDRLRALGVVAEVQGSGRVPRYRHFAYEWLGVNKVELAVMTELLLRGSQTEGELRGRAARMEPITDVAALRPVLESLQAKRLLLSLTPVGRGHVVTHNLYEPQELEKQRALHSGGGGEPESSTADMTRAPAPQASPPSTQANAGATPYAAPTHFERAAATLQSPRESALESLHEEVNSLRRQITELRSELAELTAAHERTTDELRSMRNALGGERPHRAVHRGSRHSSAIGRRAELAAERDRPPR